jgi:hypothetical protein
MGALKNVGDGPIQATIDWRTVKMTIHWKYANVDVIYDGTVDDSGLIHGTLEDKGHPGSSERPQWHSETPLSCVNVYAAIAYSPSDPITHLVSRGSADHGMTRQGAGMKACADAGGAQCTVQGSGERMYSTGRNVESRRGHSVLSRNRRNARGSNTKS